MNKNDDEVEVNSLIVEEKIMNKNWNFKFGQISSRANPWSTSKWNEGSWSSCMILVTKLGTMQIKLSAVYKFFFSPIVQNIMLLIMRSTYIPSWRIKLLWIWIVFRIVVNTSVVDQNFPSFRYEITSYINICFCLSKTWRWQIGHA